MIARAVWFTAPRTAELRLAEVDPPGPGQLLVEAECSAVSAGTELLAYRGQVPPGLSPDLPTVEGRFEFPELLQLPREDLDFVLAFVRCSGSLKDLGKLRGQSYPTVRNRLNEIIAKLAVEKRDPEEERHAILDAIASGEMTVQEGARRLKELE